MFNVFLSGLSFEFLRTQHMIANPKDEYPKINAKLLTFPGMYMTVNKIKGAKIS